jgi:hypothetical protein
VEQTEESEGKPKVTAEYLQRELGEAILLVMVAIQALPNLRELLNRSRLELETFRSRTNLTDFEWLDWLVDIHARADETLRGVKRQLSQDRIDDLLSDLDSIRGVARDWLNRHTDCVSYSAEAKKNIRAVQHALTSLEEKIRQAGNVNELLREVPAAREGIYKVTNELVALPSVQPSIQRLRKIIAKRKDRKPRERRS